MYTLFVTKGIREGVFGKVKNLKVVLERSRTGQNIYIYIRLAKNSFLITVFNEYLSRSFYKVKVTQSILYR
jgi:hypothetical protein